MRTTHEALRDLERSIQQGDLSQAGVLIAEARAAHDARVRELLAANAAEVERRRAAERGPEVLGSYAGWAALTVAACIAIVAAF